MWLPPLTNGIDLAERNSISRDAAGFTGHPPLPIAFDPLRFEIKLQRQDSRCRWNVPQGGFEGVTAGHAFVVVGGLEVVAGRGQVKAVQGE
jgi:hypothetical protein